VTGDDELADFEDPDFEVAAVRFERLGNGRYAVFGQIAVANKVETRRVECSNPAYGNARLEEQLSELLVAHERAVADFVGVAIWS
jgi:hypothetical protein